MRIIKSLILIDNYDANSIPVLSYEASGLKYYLKKAVNINR